MTIGRRYVVSSRWVERIVCVFAPSAKRSWRNMACGTIRHRRRAEGPSLYDLPGHKHPVPVFAGVGGSVYSCRHREGWNRINDHLSLNEKGEVDGVLVQLEAAGMVRNTTRKPNGAGRPATVWELVR
jgi:hypothetical protein